MNKYLRIDDETKKKIAAIVMAGHGFALIDYVENFIRSQDKEMFKESIDQYYKKIL